MKNVFYKNKAQAISVRKGCTLETYDDSDFSDDQKKFTATDKDLHLNLGDHLSTLSTNKVFIILFILIISAKGEGV